MTTTALASSELERLKAALRRPVDADPAALASAANALLHYGATDEALDARSPDTTVAHPIEQALAPLREGDFERLGRALDLGALAALGDALATRLARQPGGNLCRAAWAWLDVVRRAPLPQAIANAGEIPRWSELLLRVIDASGFGVGRLLVQRIHAYGPRTMLTVPSAGDAGRHSWLEVGTRVDRIALGLLALLDERGAGPVALISENRYEMALVDLACLAYGIVNVMVPPDATPDNVELMLQQSGAVAAVVSTHQQHRRIDWDRLEQLHTVVSLDAPVGPTRDLLSLAELERRGQQLPESRLGAQLDALSLDATATIMYTSGSTGRPKGIRFTHRNVIFKRFARALAIPGIDDHAVFLCYLPLCHTFGRYLELLGTVFWGASYVFIEDTSIDSMIDQFRAYRPTVFISIPLKWAQLYEQIGNIADPETDAPERLRAATRSVVGDRLRWGLSAAGYLDPEIFRFFHDQGIELMSGFGMTEATGGITMTPPGCYRPGTLGVPLPGVEVQLDTDGELMIRGPYVAPGYVDPDDSAVAYHDGWLRTGDLMERDDEGYYRIVDRKKDILKNIKGETISPQRIESLFADIASVKRVVLIGDHRPYNTALIVPNAEVEGFDLTAMSGDDRYDFFLSHVVTVNRFLSPFERIVDFAVLERDLDEERGELTAKGTYRRQQIERSFSATIERLYQRGRYRLEEIGLELRVPNWLFQASGVTVGGFELHDGTLTMPGGGQLVIASMVGPDGAPAVRVGSCCYRFAGRAIDLGALLSTPSLWLGNDELLAFAPVGQSRRFRRKRAPRDVEMLGRVGPYRPVAEELTGLQDTLAGGAAGLPELALAAPILASSNDGQALAALQLIERVLATDNDAHKELALSVLRRSGHIGSIGLRRRVLLVLLPAEHERQATATVRRFLVRPELLLDAETCAALVELRLSERVIETLSDLAYETAQEAPVADPATHRRQLGALLDLLVGYGAVHPAHYQVIRRALARVRAFAADVEDARAGAAAGDELVEHFRRWLGAPQRIAVDPETGREYRWSDVVGFDDAIEDGDRQRMLTAIAGSALLQEATFLLSDGAIVRLSDIPPGGVWISPLWRRDGRVLYRATVHSRHGGSYNLVIGVNHAVARDELREDLLWLQALGAPGRRASVVARFGGYWRQVDIWTEQYIGSRTAELQIERLDRRGDLPFAWHSVVWYAARACFRFWRLTDERFVPEDLSPANFIVPGDDYQSGSRLVTVRRRPFVDLAELLTRFRASFLDRVRADYALVGDATPWDSVFAGLIELVGVERGLSQLKHATASLGGDVAFVFNRYAAEVERRGFVPRQIHMAIHRYREWAALVEDATVEARARMLQDLTQTYALVRLRHRYPEAHVRLFRHTVFEEASERLREKLDELIDDLRHRRTTPDELPARMATLRGHTFVDENVEYFLARLSHPHLAPGDAAEFLGAGEREWASVVVSLEDATGRTFQIRPPISPREIGRLHRLFLAAHMDAAFQSDHQFLVAIDDRGNIVGGLYYTVDLEGRQGYLDKVVVAEHKRSVGIGDALMEQMFQRLSAAGVRAVTTGFYRRGYFFRLGFGIEAAYGGLVKRLGEPAGAPPLPRPRR